jgi:hypothetical protein
MAIVDLDALAERAANKAVEHVFERLGVGGHAGPEDRWEAGYKAGYKWAMEHGYTEPPEGQPSNKTSRAARKAEAKAEQRETNLTPKEG